MDKRYKGLSFMQGKLYVPSSTREVYGRLIRLDEEVKVHEDVSPYTTVAINPSKEKQIITPSKPFIAFGEVIVNPISDEYIIPEGELTVTENGTYNVTDKANVIVNTPIPSGTLEITENGEYDISYKEKVDVNVRGGGATFNVEFSQTAPENTSKLWIKDGYAEGSTINISSNTQNREAIFTTIAQFPAGRLAEAAYAQVGSSVYIFGGIIVTTSGSSTTTTQQNTVYKYDMATQQLTRLFPTGVALPTMQGSSASAYGDNIYIFGGKSGSTYLSSIYKYNVLTNTLSRLSTTMPVAKFAFPTVVVDDKIYIFGGRSTSNDRTSDIYIFDATTETIKTSSAQLKIGEFGHIAYATPNKNIYIFSGYRVTSVEYYVQSYHIDTDTVNYWRVAQGGMANRRGVVVGYNIYLFGNTWTNCYDTRAGSIYPMLSTNITNHGHLSQVGYWNNKAYVISSYYSADICTVDFTFPLEKDSYYIECNPRITPMTIYSVNNINISDGVAQVWRGNNNSSAEIVDAYKYNGTAWENVFNGETYIE